VLHRAYVAPAATLEKAAEVLDLPSSTFRRLLSTIHPDRPRHRPAVVTANSKP